MLTAGDELGRTQKGNNNAYCQDSGTSWLVWAAADHGLVEFVRRVLQLRAQFPVLRRTRFFDGDLIDGTGAKDIAWLTPEGREFVEADWHQPDASCLGVRYAVGEGNTCCLLLLANASPSPVDFALPPGSWRCLLDTARAAISPDAIEDETYALETRSLAMFVDTGPS